MVTPEETQESQEPQKGTKKGGKGKVSSAKGVMAIKSQFQEDIISLAHRLAAVREMRKAADKTEKEILPQLRQFIDPLCIQYPEGKFKIGHWIIHRVSGVNRRLDADILMEKGVDPGIIQEATKETPFFQYRVGNESNDVE